MSQMQNHNPSLGREFAKYAFPAVIGMVVSSLYNIVDGIFVGRGVGETGLGAISIVYPFIMLEIAITMMLAIGGANHFSACRGRGDDKAANNYFTQSMVLVTAAGLLLNLLVLLFTPAVCRLLGADETILPYAREYIWWIALFGIINMPAMALSIFVRNDGAPRRELAGTLSGTVVNIVLDYLFIMVFGWGMAGAAIATGIGQTVSALIFLTHFLQKKRTLRFEKPMWRGREVKRLLFSGAPSFLMEFSQSAVTFSFNLVLMQRVGPVGVSYYSIVMYICSMFNMVLIGLTQGAQPIMSFRHGREDNEAVEALRRIATRTALVLTTLIYAAVFFFGGALAAIFVPGNPGLTALAADMMRLYFLAFFPVGITLMNILYFQVTEQSRRSILLSLLRCVGFIQLFLLVLPPLFGTPGIYLSFLCGEGCHWMLSALMMHRHRGEQRREALQKKSPAAQPGR